MENRFETDKGYLIAGNALQVLSEMDSKSVDCIITSPPYYRLRDYGHPGQIGMEQSPCEYLAKLTLVFSECKRILKPEGTLWINIGDTYVGGGGGRGESRKNQNDKVGMPKSPSSIPGIGGKQLLGIPWSLAFILQSTGWIIRNDIIWYKPNAVPEAVKDRCAKSHEHIFLLSKKKKYYFDHKAIQEPAKYDGRKKLTVSSLKYGGKDHTLGKKDRQRWQTDDDGNFVKNKRDVWIQPLVGSKENHWAQYPMELIRPMIEAGCPKNGIVLDPFIGSGTTAIGCVLFDRRYIGIDVNSDYLKRAHERILETINHPEYQPCKKSDELTIFDGE